ncbi:MAG: hypothetical protein ACTHK3_10795 [Solirubrobacterales bacterium]
MELSDQQLIAEAIETNHAGVRKDRTLDRYRDHLVHYSHYLASVFGVSFYTARRKHVRMFMNHLAKPLVALLPQELPGRDQIPLPPLPRRRGPARPEPGRAGAVAEGADQARLHAQLRGRVMGKGDIFDLAPRLIRALRLYRHWQLSEATRNEAIREALADPETAYVLLTRSGRKTTPQTIGKLVKWHAVKAGVGLRKIAQRVRRGQRPHHSRLPALLPPGLGNHRAQREGTAHRRRLRGLEAQRHHHDPPPLRPDEIRAGAGSAAGDAADVGMRA